MDANFITDDGSKRITKTYISVCVHIKTIIQFGQSDLEKFVVYAQWYITKHSYKFYEFELQD